MNAYTSQDELALLSSSKVSHAAPIAAAKPRQSGLFGWVQAFLARQATLAELHSLSDRELADIGLHRAALSDVFNPGFVASRTR